MQANANAGKYNFSFSKSHKPTDKVHSFILIFENIVNRHCPGTSHNGKKKISGIPCTAVQTVYCIIPEKTKWVWYPHGKIRVKRRNPDSYIYTAHSLLFIRGKLKSHTRSEVFSDAPYRIFWSSPFLILNIPQFPSPFYAYLQLSSLKYNIFMYFIYCLPLSM